MPGGAVPPAAAGFAARLSKPDRLLVRPHEPDPRGRERQLVRHCPERGQRVGDGVGHQPADRDDRALHKRYLVHVAGHNLGILMRLLIGAGTPREAAARALAYLLFVYTEEAVSIILIAASPDGFAVLVMAVPPTPGRSHG